VSKIDIAEGFYRIAIRPEDVFKLAIMFPTEEGEEQWVGFPLVLPMGWKQSPHLFTAATETFADLANNKLHSNHPSPPKALTWCLRQPFNRRLQYQAWSRDLRRFHFQLVPLCPATASPFRSSPGMCMSTTLSAWCRVTLRTDDMSSPSCLAPWTKCYAN
jgi:hypothetical protein